MGRGVVRETCPSRESGLRNAREQFCGGSTNQSGASSTLLGYDGSRSILNAEGDVGHDQSASDHPSRHSCLHQRGQRELGSVRKLVKKALEDNDYHAVEQDNFPPDYRDLIDKLRERIDRATPWSTSPASATGPNRPSVPPTPPAQLHAARIRHRRRAGQAGLRLPDGRPNSRPTRTSPNPPNSRSCKRPIAGA